MISKEANFVTVRLNDRAELAEALPGPIDLLCSVRALLKKIKQTVLVGDNVQVDSIDWADKRGQTALKPIFEATLFELSCVGFLVTPGFAFERCLAVLHGYICHKDTAACLPAKCANCRHAVPACHNKILRARLNVRFACFAHRCCPGGLQTAQRDERPSNGKCRPDSTSHVPQSAAI